VVTPETILRWHRNIARRRRAAKPMRGNTGRPATRRNFTALVLRPAPENPERGYRRIHGELASPAVKIAASTAREILRKTGIDPAPRRTPPTWSQFLRSQAEAILASDFFTADLLDGTQAYVLAVIEHATRRIRILGVTLHPTGERTTQQTRNLLLDLGEQTHRVKLMIRDRGPDNDNTDSWKNGRLRQPPDYQESLRFTGQTGRSRASPEPATARVRCHHEIGARSHFSRLKPPCRVR
jgi:putative transposase